MKTLVIYAHPDHESHAKHTLELVEAKLKHGKEDYEVLDLYHIKFDPVLSKEELYERREKGPLADVAKMQKKISDSDHLIVIYPIWWNGMPAILKGFIDRVFGPGFAYKYVNGIPHGLLKGKKATVFATTGSKKLLTCLFLGNRFKKNATRDIFGFCGIKAKVYHTDAALGLNDNQKEKIRKNVEKALK